MIFFKANSGSKPTSVLAKIQMSFLTAMLLAAQFGGYAFAASSDAGNTEDENLAPPPTLLVPLIPKIDTTAADDTEEKKAQVLNNEPEEKPDPRLKAAPKWLSAERGADEDVSGVTENTTLKGTVQLVADDTEYDQDTNTFLGTGNAVVTIGGENSKLEADTILYDQNNQVIDARGSVRIIRDGQLTTGSAFKFKLTSDEYLITNPDTEIQGSDIIARQGYGKGGSMAFKEGTLQLPKPIFIERSSQYGPTSNIEEMMRAAQHPDAFLPVKPSFVFKARRMTYERFKETGNFTVFGGRMMFGRFGVPVPKFTATLGAANSRVLFPHTFNIGNNLQMGGTSIGPSFNYAVGKQGAFMVSPLIQIGSKNSYSGTNESGNIGAGCRITYEGMRLSGHLAYGSVSNLVVADLKYQITKSTKFQSGINRFLDDGIFGVRRARYLAEVVDYRVIGTIPYLAALTFRTSGGWAEDDPRLLNLNPNYKKLFDVGNPNVRTKAWRVQEQISAVTQPVFSFGDEKMGARMNVFSSLGLRGYSTGDSMIMAQAGPILDLRLDRVRLQTGYVQSGVKGQSPFVFDQFIQGNKSTFLGGDIKLFKWLAVGGSLGYNLDSDLLTYRTVNAAIGPPDLKFIASYDTIRGINRFGFDVLYGQPIPFNKLILKGNPDAGQLGGGI